MMTKEVDFYFDFASPNAYLSHKVLKSISEKTGAKVNYIPVLLGGIFKATNNNPPMVQFAEVKGKLEYQSLEITSPDAIISAGIKPKNSINNLLSYLVGKTSL